MTSEAVQHLVRSDKILARIIRQVGPCQLTPKKRRSPFEALVQSVAHQQLNGTAANTILRRVIALYPHRRFPLPEDLLRTPDEHLRGAGLSRAKTASLKDIAAKTIQGVVPTARRIAKMSDAEILERLTTVRGVGPWTVEMLLMFTLGRPDVLPVTDYGVRKGFALAYGLSELPTPRELLNHGEKWRPHRTTAAWYLWRAVELLQ
ncbi:MAG TPA: DNA-3-methyladenine glycosylase [Verrucomicrobiae bacterium]|nr:DNA-3-methyladenine glycosylase [Verrucomicrobiae bacterium]